MTKDEYKKRAKELAIAAEYDDVEEALPWKDYVIFDPIFNDDEMHYIGLPLTIMCKGDEVRWSTPTEAMAMLSRLPD